MKIEIITNGKKSYPDIPTNWDEVTFGQFLQLTDDKVKAISVCTGIDYDTLTKAKIINFDGVMNILSFLNTAPIPKIPETILGYPVPKNLEFEQVQMYLDLKDYIAQSKSPTELLAQYPLFCAVYACSTKNGKYDWKLAEAMKDEFLNAPCTEVMGIGHFTLAKLTGLKLNMQINFRLPITVRQKIRLALKGFRLRMGQYLRSFILKRKPT